jgi:hypothetical protein
MKRYQIIHDSDLYESIIYAGELLSWSSEKWKEFAKPNKAYKNIVIDFDGRRLKIGEHVIYTNDECHAYRSDGISSVEIKMEKDALKIFKEIIDEASK